MLAELPRRCRESSVIRRTIASASTTPTTPWKGEGWGEGRTPGTIGALVDKQYDIDWPHPSNSAYCEI
jgi:hypothetical protein